MKSLVRFDDPSRYSPPLRRFCVAPIQVIERLEIMSSKLNLFLFFHCVVYTMEAKFAKGIVFKRVVESIKDFVPEANFICSREGISLQAMDTAHVALVSVFFSREAFESYVCNTDIPLGLNISSLTKTLKMAESDDSIHLKAQLDGDQLEVRIEQSRRTAKFQLALMNLDMDQLQIPEQECDCQLQMNSSEFKKICADLAAFGDTIILYGSPEGFSFDVKGVEGQASIQLTDLDQLDCEVDVELEFAIRYLNLFSKATVLSPTVHLRLSGNTPLIVEYPFEHGYIKFYLSPKIIDE